MSFTDMIAAEEKGVVNTVQPTVKVQQMKPLQNFVKIGEIDTLPLLLELHGDKWHEDTYLRDYPQGPFGETESIILRFPPRSVLETEEALRNFEKNFDQHENVWLPISEEFPIAKHIAAWLMFNVQGTRLGRVIINKINPGGKIYRHADTPAHADYWSRFHVVIHAKHGVDFWCEDEMVNMVTGEVWYFRNDLEHEVVNNTDDVRIHLVIDIKTNIDKPKKAKPEVKSEMVHPFPMKKPYEGPKGIHFKTELLKDVQPDLLPFVPLHWAELGLTKDDVPVDMDWERYFKLEQEGKLHLLIARDGEKIIGYQFTFVGGHFHYKSTTHGMVDLYYLLPEYRKGRTGIRLIQEAEKELKKLGVKKIITGTKMHLNMSKLFTYLGYSHSDETFIKIIQ